MNNLTKKEKELILKVLELNEKERKYLKEQLERKTYIAEEQMDPYYPYP